jgi:hypothetical protein
MTKWNYKQDIEYDSIDKDRVKDNKILFYMLSVASFIEITSETYANNLKEFYDDNDEITSWLKDDWEKEEVQHGKSLKRYVLTIWSEFDWEKAYKRFLELYLPLCSEESLQKSKGLEMVARMIVETGTSTFYRAIEKYASKLNEPVLQKLAHFIYKDEVRHYSYFDKYYNFYNQKEKLPRAQVLKVISKRLKDVNSEDVEMAFRAVYETLNNGSFDNKEYDLFLKNINKMASENYPYNMAIKMMIHPLRINRILESSMVPVVRGAMRVIGI